jgi:glycosyltransferase involved in cell wall biosynthesis
VAVFYTGGALEEEARRTGIQIVDLRRKGRWDLILFFFRLVRLVKSEKPDILHSYLQVPNIWAALVKLVLPHTKVIWGIRASNVDMKRYDWQWQLTDKVESLLAKIPDWIICNSQAGLLYHVGKGYPRKKMSVIHNGIDTNHFFPNRELGQLLRRQWGIQDGQKLIGTVGRMDPAKDYPNFLRAASLLMQMRQDVRFVCVGGGPDVTVREYRELAHSLNLQEHLIWAGEQAEMLNIYNALDIFVSSSMTEGVSNVIGEAMACKIPCVVTDVGDSALLVASLGEVVPPGDSEALKQGILTLLNRIEKGETSLGTKVRQRINDLFGTARLVSGTRDVFAEVLTTKA